MNTLQDRVAIITGAGRGLGREHALLFATLGAKVVVNDNGAGPDGAAAENTAAHEVVAEIKAAGGDAVAHTGSVSHWDTGKELVETAIKTYGRLDVLVNNAGILRDRFLAGMSEEEFDSVIDVHLKGHFVPLRHAAAYWKDQAKAGATVQGSVINTSSGSGLRGNPGQTNYAAAKAGIAAMTQVAARELERYGVKVNAIAPVARTRLTVQTPGLGERMAEESDGFDRWAPGNVSPLVAWLARANNTVSGQVFTVVGGQIQWERGWTGQGNFSNDHRWTQDELDKALASMPEGIAPFQEAIQSM